MKKTILFIFTVFQILNLNAQQNPVGNPPANNTIIQANSSWFRGGNNLGTIPNNIFGTLWNSPIYTQTNGRNHMKLNGTTTYTVNGIASPNSKEGYLLLGLQPQIPALLDLFQTNNFVNNAGAYSQLHITGLRATSQGYRPWMHTGVTFTDNDDLSYFGTRKLGTVNTTNQNETVICWSNDRSNAWGFDDMSFRFANEANPSPTGPATLYNNTINNTDFNTANDLDGRHVARFSGTGELGLGNTFGVNISLPPNSTWLNTIYVRPKSLAHLSTSVLDSVWLQFTNRHTAINTGTGENATDGLRIGIIGADTSNAATLLGNGTAAIYNQEKRPILMSTDARTSTVAPITGNTSERVRVTSVSTPTNLPSPASGMGVFNPGVFTPSSADTNITRVSISHNPAFPVTRPLSLLHLGYNSTTTTSATTTDGWRSWMDVGMFTSNQSDHVYLGLKNESLGPVNNKQDAVLGWGDDPSDTLGNGADNLRFIFTAASTNNISPANTTNGLEVGRMVPTIASTLSAPNFGMMGIGDFSPSSPNNGVTGGVINNVDAKLDIDGDLRIRTVTRRDSLMRVLVIDTLDHNRVHYRDINTFTGSFGNICGNTQNPLTNHHEIPMNNNNVVFTDPNSAISDNRVGIGFSPGNCIPSAKLHVLNQNYGSISSSPVNGVLIQNAQSTISSSQGLGVNNNSNSNLSTGISSVAIGGIAGNIGIMGNAGNTGANNTGIIGGAMDGFQSNTGMSASAQGPAPFNLGIGAFATKSPNSPQNTGFCVGVNAQASRGKYAVAGNFNASGGLNNYGVYSTAPSAAGNYAGYFNGNVLVTGTATVSDQMFKTNVSEISNALKMVKALHPKTYFFDTIQYNNSMSFGSGLQYGFIAQEVLLTNPEIVGLGVHPSKIDSLGQEIAPSFDYKTVNYNAIIPINTQAIKELNIKVDKQTLSDQTTKTNVQNLTGSLNKILAMRGVSFNWNQNILPEYDLDNTEHVGFIAQEINAVDPRLTFVSDENLMHVDYNKIVPIAVEAIQELNGQIAQRDSIITSLNDRLTHLENCLSGILPFLCQISHNSIQTTQQEFQQQLKAQIDVQLSNKGTIILNQNVPNPFAEQTQISFSIPETVKKAQIHFYDANGKLINSVEIQERGLGQLNVFANDLSTGMYTYTLIADGQIVATKKMMKQ